MNVLFYLDHSVPSRFGGIERVTGQVASAMHSKGVNVYYIYRALSCCPEDAHIDECFEDRKYIKDIKAEKDRIKSILVNWHIDAIVVQSVFDDSIIVWRDKIKLLPHPCKLVFAYHYNPGSEYDFLRWDNINLQRKSICDISSLFTWIKSVVHFSKEIVRWRRYVRRIYGLIYKNCDNVVVLSKQHIAPWMKLAGTREMSKFVVIPHMLSFSEFLNTEDLKKKENIALVVSRLSENEKRISLILKLWKKIESDNHYNDWKLIVVGDGPDRQSYEEYARGNLRNVEFVGKQNTEKYYRKASILMLSSKQEGWGLVLTEAQQMGCVPICLKSFPSASDIISDGENGYLPDSMSEFKKRLESMMSDENLRHRLARNAV